MPTIEERARKHFPERVVRYPDDDIPYNKRQSLIRMGYIKGAKDQREVFLDAYCKTCCNLDRKKCLELDGMCKQYAKLIKNMEG